METENVHAQADAVEQEEQAVLEAESFEPESSEETVTIPKSKYAAIRRKALAHDANKQVSSKPITNSGSDTLKLERLELKVDGYSDEEVAYILKNGGKEALKDPFVISGIEARRVQKAAESAMLGSEGQKSGTTGSLSPAEFAKLSAADQLNQLTSL